jgi:phage shock protein A
MADSIQALYDQLTARRDAYLAETADLRAEVERLRAALQPLEDQYRAASAKLDAARDKAEYQQVSQQIAKLSRVLDAQSGKAPGKTLKAEGAGTTAAPGTLG